MTTVTASVAVGVRRGFRSLGELSLTTQLQAGANRKGAWDLTMRGEMESIQRQGGAVPPLTEMRYARVIASSLVYGQLKFSSDFPQFGKQHHI